MSRKPIVRVEVRLLNVDDRVRRIPRTFPGCFIEDGLDLVCRSPLDDEDVNAHLKRFHGMLQDGAHLFRKAIAEGAVALCRIYVRARPFVIEPESLLLAHKRRLRTEIHLSR